MSRKSIFYIVFFSILVIGFYLVITKLVPAFSQAVVPISYVRPFAFTNQDGKTITEKDVAGKVYVAEYFFTTCKGICPKMNNNMRSVYDRFKNEKNFLILSHTCNPETDSVAQLKHYADSLGVNTSRWMFLTGRKDSLYTMARISYTIDDPSNNLKNTDDDFMHTQLWALVNGHGDVINIYDGLKESEVQKLIRDIEKLLKEKQ